MAGWPKTLVVGAGVLPNKLVLVAGCPKPLNIELVVLLVAVLLKPKAGADVAGAPKPLNMEFA